jgi:hypothetical protein
LAAVIFLPLQGSAAEQSRSFDKMLKMNGISFHVTCSNEGSLNDLKITPAGLFIDNSPIIKKEVDGAVTGAEVADLNGDGFPEIYVYINSAGSGSYGSLVAYGSNHNKSLSEIYLPPLEDDARNAKGYMGHDEFAVVDGNLARRFPLYKENDSNARPTDGMRELLYKLVPGEAGWKLKVNSSVTR